MDNKKSAMIIAIVVILILAVIVATVAFLSKNETVDVDNPGDKEHVISQSEPTVKVEEDGTKTNISKKMKEASFTIEGLKIDNIQISYYNGKTFIKADVTNETEEQKEDIALKMTLLDQAGNLIVSANGYIGIVSPKGVSKLNAEIPLDYAEAYSISIEKRS
ncbi:MAG: hypothetical protein IJ217_00945 [Clostridia bacterium]|nr:hypothetical protein [Clostridia bacterium]